MNLCAFASPVPIIGRLCVFALTPVARAEDPAKSHFLYYCAVIVAAGLCAAIWTFVIRQIVIAWCEFSTRREQHQDHQSHSGADHRSHPSHSPRKNPHHS